MDAIYYHASFPASTMARSHPLSGAFCLEAYRRWERAGCPDGRIFSRTLPGGTFAVATERGLVNLYRRNPFFGGAYDLTLDDILGPEDFATAIEPARAGFIGAQPHLPRPAEIGGQHYLQIRHMQPRLSPPARSATKGTSNGG